MKIKEQKLREKERETYYLNNNIESNFFFWDNGRWTWWSWNKLLAKTKEK